jgi:hypothetical protein
VKSLVEYPLSLGPAYHMQQSDFLNVMLEHKSDP